MYLHNTIKQDKHTQ